MPAQATRINQLVSDALGLDVESTRWRTLSRQITATDPLSVRIRSIGGAIDIGYLDRTIASAALQEAIDRRHLPLVLLAPDDTSAVVLASDGDHVTAQQVRADGTEQPIPNGSAPLGQRCMQAVGASGATRVLAPMALRSAMSAMGDSAPHAASSAAHAPAAEHLTPIERTFALMARERREILTVFFYAALSGGLSLILPLAVGGIVQLVQGRLFLQPVIVLIAFVILGTIGAGVIQIGILKVVERIQQRVFARMALEFAFRVPRLTYSTSLESNLPEQMNRLFEAVVIQKGVQKLLVDVPTALLTTAFGLVLLTLYSPWFSVFAIIVVVILVGIIRWTGPEGLRTSIAESKYKYKAVHWLEEMTRAFHAFKFAGDSTLPVERMDDVIAGYLKYRRKHFAVLVRQTIALIGFKTFITAATLILGATLVQTNRLLLGQFVGAEVVIVTVLVGVEKLISSLATVYDVLTSVDKAGHVADLSLEARGGLAPIHPPGVGLLVEARDLRYRYPGAARPSLDGITLRILPGERVAIMGVDGSGRSTLLKVLSGVMDNYDGTIQFDGVTLRDLDRPALRSRIGQMLSWTDLFDGTVEENVAVGRAHIDPHQVRQVLEALGLTDEIQQLPQGMQTELTNGGRSLPAHLANKLLVAQGIVGEPRLVVLDDFFTNLDGASRTLIIQLLTDRSRPWTVLAVSHDPQLLSAFDRVIIVDGGQIVCEGPFETVRHEPACRRLLRDDAASPMPTAEG